MKNIKIIFIFIKYHLGKSLYIYINIKYIFVNSFTKYIPTTYLMQIKSVSNIYSEAAEFEQFKTSGRIFPLLPLGSN